MNNNTHIFPEHISQVGVGKTHIENSQTQNKMADGGTVDNDISIGSKGLYQTRSGLINIEITNVTDKGWVIFKDDSGKRKDAKLNDFKQKWFPNLGPTPSNSTLNTATTNTTTPLLEVGKAYLVDDFEFEIDADREYFSDYKYFQVYSIFTRYRINYVNYQGVDFQEIGFDEIKPKQKPGSNLTIPVGLDVLEIGKTYQVNNFSFLDMSVDKYFLRNNYDEFKIFNIDAINGVYLIEEPKFKGGTYWSVRFENLLPKKAISNPTLLLEKGKTYSIDDFEVLDKNIELDFLNKNDFFTVYEIHMKTQRYGIEEPGFTGTMYWYIKFSDLVQKHPPVVPVTVKKANTAIANTDEWQVGDYVDPLYFNFKSNIAKTNILNTVQIFSVEKNSSGVVIGYEVEEPNYNGTEFWYITKDELLPKSTDISKLSRQPVTTKLTPGEEGEYKTRNGWIPVKINKITQTGWVKYFELNTGKKKDELLPKFLAKYRSSKEYIQKIDPANFVGLKYNVGDIFNQDAIKDDAVIVSEYIIKSEGFTNKSTLLTVNEFKNIITSKNDLFLIEGIYIYKSTNDVLYEFKIINSTLTSYFIKSHDLYEKLLPTPTPTPTPQPTPVVNQQFDLNSAMSNFNQNYFDTTMVVNELSEKEFLLNELEDFKELIANDYPELNLQLQNAISNLDSYILTQNEIGANNMRNTSIDNNNESINQNTNNKKTNNKKPKIDLNEIMNRPDAPKELTEMLKNVDLSKGFDRFGF